MPEWDIRKGNEVMRTTILTVRPAPDSDFDVAALWRRGVPALASPMMAPTYLAPSLAEVRSCGGVIFTSRHAVTGLLACNGGKPDADMLSRPVFAVGRATGRAARDAGFRDVRIGHGGGAGLVPLIRSAKAQITSPLLWPAALHRGFDMVSALADVAEVTLLPVYEMMETKGLPDSAEMALANNEVLAVVLMSARSARLFRNRLTAAGHDGAVADMALIAGSDAIAVAAGGGWAESFVAKRPTRARLLAIAALLYDRRTRP